VEPVQEWREVGGRVREARVAARLSQTALAAVLGIDRTALVRVESGQRQVSALELFRLADALAVPAAFFLTRPRASVLSRRTTLVDGADEASRLAWQADVELDAHVRDVEWLREQGRLPPPAATAVEPRPAADADAAAGRAREARAALGLASGPLGPLADVCEQFGLFLLVIDRDVEGASVLLEAGPPAVGAAVVGGRAPAGRRRWTAAHELGHHLLADEYHSDVGVAASRDEREKVVDAFAGELLLPAADLRGVFAQAGAMTSGELRRAMVGVAGTYRVSWTAAVGRAEEAGALPVSVCEELRGDVPVRGELVRVLGYHPPEDLAVGTTGAGWRRAVLDCHADGRITAARAVELLHGALGEDDLPDTPGEPPP
jgi:transcriptional regulator with XRE-family HTH domain